VAQVQRHGEQHHRHRLVGGGQEYGHDHEERGNTEDNLQYRGVQ
jgi:hypothetical protein